MRRPGASREPGFAAVRLGSACQAPPSVAVQRPCLTEFCGSEPAPSLAVPSATREPGLTEACGMTLTAMARLACMSLRPVRQAPPPVAAQRPGRFPRAGPYGDLRHDLHCHGAFCVHEPAPGASGTATCHNAKAMTLINSPAPASPPRLPIHLIPSARAIRPVGLQYILDTEKKR